MIWLVIVWQFLVYLWDLRVLGDFENSWLGTPFHFPIVPLFLAGIILFLPFTRVIAPLFEASLFKFFARISYSVYLWHALVIILLKEFIFPKSTVLFTEWVMLLMTSILITLFIAWASQLVLEHRLSQWCQMKWGK